jgi:multiple sugar transport system ATP-binding protein
MNTFEASLESRDGGMVISFDGGELNIPTSRVSDGSLDGYVGKSIIIGIRPEDFHIEDEQKSLGNSSLIDTQVELSEQIGSGVYLYVLCGGKQLIATLPPSCAARHGESVRLAVDCDKLYMFDKDNEESI